jgi:hypothetical protein
VSPHRVRVEGDLFHGRIPADAVYVGRAVPGFSASPYANPHRVGPCRCGETHDRAGAVDAHWRHLRRTLSSWPQICADLAGRDLACWCPLPAPGEPDLCHGATLLALANEEDPE